MAKKLTDTAATILATAAARSDHRVLPLPKLKAPPVAVQKTIKSLLADGLVGDVAAARGDAVWDGSDQHGRRTLAVTPAGLTAIGIKAAPAEAVPHRGKRPTSAKAGKGGVKPANKPSSARTAAKGPTKQQLIVGMLRRPNGASIAELVKGNGVAGPLRARRVDRHR
jgi:hypothetical protein